MVNIFKNNKRRAISQPMEFRCSERHDAHHMVIDAWKTIIHYKPISLMDKLTNPAIMNHRYQQIPIEW